MLDANLGSTALCLKAMRALRDSLQHKEQGAVTPELVRKDIRDLSCLLLGKGQYVEQSAEEAANQHESDDSPRS